MKQEWVQTKSHVIEGLLASTEHLRRIVLKGDEDAIDQALAQRKEFLRELKKIDEQMKGQTTPHDATWSAQLSFLETRGSELMTELQRSREKEIQDFERIKVECLDFLEDCMMGSKGHRVSIEG